jgi:hypothetical protein
MAKRGPKTVSPTRASAYLAFARNDGASDAQIASELSISRQRVSILRKAFREATATSSSETVADKSRSQPSTPAQSGGQSQATPHSGPSQSPYVGFPLASESGALLLFVIEMPEHIAAMVDGVAKRHYLTADRVRDLAIARLNGTSRAGSWKSIGVSPDVGRGALNKDRELQRIMEWAEGVSELRLAANATRIATSLSPNAVAALSFVLERQHEGWQRESVLRIEGEIEHKFDMSAMLRDPAQIARVSELEALLQNAEPAQLPAHEGEIIDGELVEPAPVGEIIEGTPRVDAVRPEFPEDDGIQKREPIEVLPRTNRPGQGDPTKRGHTREIVVDGIRTLVVDERAPGGDDRPPF